jgi:two-component system, chemotaxis family, CheB/CheR fusion protein
VVQDPATAQFAGMLRSAVTAGVADYVIAAEKMPEFLLRYGRHGYMADPDGLAAKASGVRPARAETCAAGEETRQL